MFTSTEMQTKLTHEDLKKNRGRDKQSLWVPYNCVFEEWLKVSLWQLKWRRWRQTAEGKGTELKTLDKETIPEKLLPVWKHFNFHVWKCLISQSNCWMRTTKSYNPKPWRKKVLFELRKWYAGTVEGTADQTTWKLNTYMGESKQSSAPNREVEQSGGGIRGWWHSPPVPVGSWQESLRSRREWSAFTRATRFCLSSPGYATVESGYLKTGNVSAPAGLPVGVCPALRHSPHTEQLTGLSRFPRQSLVRVRR